MERYPNVALLDASQAPYLYFLSMHPFSTYLKQLYIRISWIKLSLVRVKDFGIYARTKLKTSDMDTAIEYLSPCSGRHCCWCASSTSGGKREVQDQVMFKCWWKKGMNRLPEYMTRMLMS